jgi:ornithine cyclodeaminase
MSTSSTSEANFVFLSQEDVIAAGGLDMAATIDVVEQVLRLHAAGQTVLPQKPTIRWSDDLDSEETQGRIMAMPAWIGGPFDVAGLKWIPSVPDNPSRGLPRGIGVILLTERRTGLPLAFMDGTVVSAMRTGAVTGLICRLLAPPDARVASLLGAGVQAVTQLMGLETLPALEEVRVWDVAPGKSEQFCREQTRADQRFRLVAVDSAERACRDAQVVVPVTLAPEPYVQADWIAPGSLFVSISSLDPTVELIERSDLLVTDVWDHETGHASRPFARALAAGAVRREDVQELGQILAGARPGRTSREQRVFVSPIGLAIEDVGNAYRVYRRAVEMGIGTPLRMWKEPVWR